MKQIRVTSPFLDSTASNIRREVGDIFLAEEGRAACLVSGKLCEYVEGEKEEEEVPQAPADGEQEVQPAGDGENVAPADGEQQPIVKDDTVTAEVPDEGQKPREEGKAAETKKNTTGKKK